MTFSQYTSPTPNPLDYTNTLCILNLSLTLNYILSSTIHQKMMKKTHNSLTYPWSMCNFNRKKYVMKNKGINEKGYGKKWCTERKLFSLLLNQFVRVKKVCVAVMLRRTIFIQVISRRAHISELWTLLLNSSETRVYMKKTESTSHICIAGVCTTRDEKNIFFIATTMNVRWTRSGLWFRLISARWRVELSFWRVNMKT